MFSSIKKYFQKKKQIEHVLNFESLMKAVDECDTLDDLDEIVEYMHKHLYYYNRIERNFAAEHINERLIKVKLMIWNAGGIIITK